MVRSTLLGLGLAWPKSDGLIDRSALCPPFIASLAAELASLWRRYPDAITDLNEDEIRTHALVHEEARADRSGYAMVASAWGDDMKNVATLCGEFCSIVSILRACRAAPVMARTLAACGPLLCVFRNFKAEFEIPDAVSPEIALEKVILHRGWKVRTGPDLYRDVNADDVTWLLETFCDASLAPLDTSTIKRLVTFRDEIDTARLCGSNDKRALIDIVELACEGSSDIIPIYNENDVDVFSMLRKASVSHQSYVALLEDFRDIARHHGAVLEEVVRASCDGAHRIAMSLMVGVALPAVGRTLIGQKAALPLGRGGLLYLLPPPRAPEDPVLVAVCGDYSPPAIADAILRWRAAGYPGQQPMPLYAKYTRFGIDPPKSTADPAEIYERLRPYLANPETTFESFVESVEAAMNHRCALSLDSSSDYLPTVRPSVLSRLAGDRGSRRLLFVVGVMCLSIFVGYFVTKDRSSGRDRVEPTIILSR